MKNSINQFKYILLWFKYWVKCIYRFLIFIFKFNLWVPIILGKHDENGNYRVFYGYRKIPRLNEKIWGGLVKFQRLNQYIPSSINDFNILYLGSSALPLSWRQIFWLAKKKKAKIVLNQNGVMYPKHGIKWKIYNYPLKKLIQKADYVFYQSQFCKYCSDRFLVKKSENSEILYNCVDTAFYKPLSSKRDANRITLLLGGNQYEMYRLEVALQTLSFLINDSGFKMDLLVTGELSWTRNMKTAISIAMELAQSLGVQKYLRFTGSYNQAEAPQIYNQAHLLLHTKHNDPCPGLVIEAMSCGLPVVATDSGGVPELVGDDAGKCIPVEQGWDYEIRPDAMALASATIEIIENLEKYSEAARQRAINKFDIKPWVKRHRDIFNLLLTDA